MSYVLSAFIGIIIGLSNMLSPTPSDPQKQDPKQEERSSK